MPHSLSRRIVLVLTLAAAAPCHAQHPEDHWAWKPPARPAVPGDGHPIDAFVRAKLKAAELEPAPRA